MLMEQNKNLNSLSQDVTNVEKAHFIQKRTALQILYSVMPVGRGDIIKKCALHPER